MLQLAPERDFGQDTKGFLEFEVVSEHGSHNSAVFRHCLDVVQWNANGCSSLPCNAGQFMTDIVARAVRSRMMAGIGGKDTKPELILRRALHARGLRYRLHDRKLSGTPDMVFRRFGAVCFVHGCFWHRHEGCPFATDPATRPDFWKAKFRANVARDSRARESLLEDGWRVAVIWECALRKDRAEQVALTLDQWLRSSKREFETSLDWMK